MNLSSLDELGRPKDRQLETACVAEAHRQRATGVVSRRGCTNGRSGQIEGGRREMIVSNQTDTRTKDGRDNGRWASVEWEKKESYYYEEIIVREENKGKTRVSIVWNERTVSDSF